MPISLDLTAEPKALLTEINPPQKKTQFSQQTLTVANSMDIIQLTSIRCYGYTGYLAEERFLGQWFEVDLRLHLNLATAGNSDRIEDTLDYRSVISEVKEIVSTKKFALVEKLAETLVQAVLSHTLVQKVELKLHKVAAPIPDFGGRITIELQRSK